MEPDQKKLMEEGYTPRCFGKIGHPDEHWVDCNDCDWQKDCEEKSNA